MKLNTELIGWLLVDYCLYPQKGMHKHTAINIKGRTNNTNCKTQNAVRAITHCTQVQNKQHASRARFWLVLSKDWQPKRASECPTFTTTHLHQTCRHMCTDFSDQCCVESQPLNVSKGRMNSSKIVSIHNIFTQYLFWSTVVQFWQGVALKRKDWQPWKARSVLSGPSTHPDQR